MKTSKLFLLTVTAILMLPSCKTGENGNKSGSDEPWKWGKQKEEVEKDKVFYPKAEKTFRIVSYNVGAFSKYMTNSTDMVAAMLKEIKTDVAALNELDSCNSRHNVNQVAALAASLGGWKWYFGRAMPYKGGAYGNGVVVPKDVQILDSYVVPLPKGTGSEPRSIAVVETNRYVIGAAHLDYSTEEAALGQAAVVNAWVQEKYKGNKKPVFFCGDMNSRPGSAPITALKSVWNVLSSSEMTVPSTAPTSCIDFVFLYKDAAQVKTMGAHTMTLFHNGDVTKASDHLPIYVDVQF